VDTLKNDAVVQNEVETPTQTSSPQVEAPTTEGQTLPEANPAGVPNDPEANMSEEQRRAFQEQRLEIKRLKEEKQARLKNESAFNVFRPQAQPGQVGVNIDNYRDPITGEYNLGAYNQAVNAALQQTVAVAQQANQSVDERLDEYQARNRHPELFDDPEAEEEIASRYLYYKMSGKNVTISDIADSVAKKYSKAVSKAEKIGAEKALEQVSPKEQAALQAAAQNSNPARASQSQDDLERLRQMSRGRDSFADDAIVARLKSIPWANK
jgi:hypothetical protein